MILTKLILIFLVYLKFMDVEGHGRLLNPPARSSCWREFGSKCATEYTDNQLFCGGFLVQWNQNAHFFKKGGKCGICGDNFAGPRDYERDGLKYTGHIVRTYSVGQVIDVQVEITANHRGWYEFRLCNSDDLYSRGLDANQECLDRNLLSDENGITRFELSKLGYYNGFYNFKLKLPANLECNRCVFQWKYRTGNSWGVDEYGQGLGFGPQEEFYGCSDVRIGSSSGILTTLGLISSSSITTNRSAATTRSGTTARSATTNNNNNQCPNGDGMYPNKDTGCTTYYVCVFSGTQFFRVYEMNCPAGLLFDSKTKNCLYPYQVVC